MFSTPVVAQVGFTSSSLSLTVFADGAIRVEYILDVDTTLPRISVPLFGEVYQNIAILDGFENPLDYSLIQESVIIDTLGSDSVEISYETFDLTNKTERIWTFAEDLPIDTLVSLPERSTIISVNQLPLAISTVGDRTVITIPSGSLLLSYNIGILGTREHALALIFDAESKISQATEQGMIVLEAQQLLDDAQEKYSLEEYSESIVLAEHAIEAVQNIDSDADEIDLMIIPGVIGVVIISIAVGTLLLRRARGKRNPSSSVDIPDLKKWRDIDIAKILIENPQLRLEDQEVIRFIAESGGEAFELEIREKFQLPKTTVWRMGKRLVEAEIVEIVNLRGNNLLRILPKYAEQS
jgi:uncharacterized membrane protein